MHADAVKGFIQETWKSSITSRKMGRYVVSIILLGICSNFGVKMIWFCARCGNECNDDFSIGYATKWNATNESELRKHYVPDNLNFCENCVLYLLWSRIFPKGIRFYWDDYYLSGSKIYLSKYTRYNSNCRKFDIRYGFLDDSSNNYWDEE